MTRFWIVPLLLISSAALAQNGGVSADNRSACTRDVSRLCRAKMNDGDSVVLACLQEHRARLSKACAKLLADNGR